MSAADLRAEGITDWWNGAVEAVKKAVIAIQSRFADKNKALTQAEMTANPQKKEAVNAKKGAHPKKAIKSGQQELKRDKSKLTEKGVIFVAPDVWDRIRKTGMGALIQGMADAVRNAVDNASPDAARTSAAALLEADSESAASKVTCSWVFSEGSGNVPSEKKTDNPAPKCWSTWSWNGGSNEQCADYDLVQGPGPFQSAVAERYGKGFTCFSDEQRSTPGTKEGQRVDNVAFICRDGNGARVQTPANCKPKIYMQAAFYGQAATSTWSLSVCPIGDRKMNAFAGIEAAWTVGSTTVFNKGAMTQSGNEITEHYSVALGPKASLNGQGPGAEVGVSVGMTTDVKNDFKDTKAAAFVIGTHEIQETAMSILKSSATVTMTAAGRVAGSAEVSTLGLGVWYVMEAQGVTAADCKGAATTYNYFITGNDKFEEIKQTAKRFFASRQVQTEL